MTTLQVYLRNPRVKAALQRRPGDEGFSLIELVVVVAVLAILAAIAIPAFTSINDNAAQAAAKNTLATIAKECGVKKANGEALTFNVPKLNSYDISPTNSSGLGDCTGGTSGEIVATKPASVTNAVIPSRIAYNVNTGAKTCTTGTNQTWCQGGAW